MKSPVVLVTGANGWLGRRLSRLIATRSIDHPITGELPANIRVRCLLLPDEDDSDLRAIGSNVEVVRGDVTKPKNLETFLESARGALLFHTAGVIHPERTRQFYEINVEGTGNVLRSAAAVGVRRAVVVSSNSPLGCNPSRDHRFDEGSPYNPYMNYGRSKMEMETAVKEFERRGDLETVLVRPPWFYGPDQPPRQTQFFAMIREGKGPIVGDGNNLRSMGYVDNLCQGLLLAALVERARGQTYWIADKRPYTMNEIIDTVERLLEQEFGMAVAHKRMRLPGMASEVAWLADTMIQGLGFYNTKVHVLSEMNKTIACDVGRAERDLGYEPKVALEEGMRRSIRWCIDKGIRIQ